MKKEGRSIIYISHKLEEIFEIADEITVMRDGQYVGKWPISDITIDELIHQMVGRDMEERFPPAENVGFKRCTFESGRFYECRGAFLPECRF